MTDMEFSAGPGIGLPVRYVRRAWVTVGLLMCMGAWVSWYLCEWMWLARFGALITIAAMVFATFNPHLEAGLLVQHLNDYMDPSDAIYERIRAKPYMYGVQQPLTDEQAKEVLEREVAAYSASTRAILSDEMTSALRKLELRIAVVGTLTWAFADLINKL